MVWIFKWIWIVGFYENFCIGVVILFKMSLEKDLVVVMRRIMMIDGLVYKYGFSFVEGE